MLNISTIHSVSWPSPASVQVAAVSAVDPVRPVQDGRRSGQPGADHTQTPEAGQPQRQQRKRVSTAEGDQALPPLRQGGAESGRSGRVAARGAGQADEVAARRAAEQAAKEQAAEQAEQAQARRQQLQAVLSDVWKASAAVVDRVLGRDGSTREEASPAAGVEAAGPTANATGLLAVKRNAVEPLPWPVMPEEPVWTIAGQSAPAEIVPTQDVVAYDERGNSSLAPLETGMLLDRRI